MQVSFGMIRNFAEQKNGSCVNYIPTREQEYAMNYARRAFAPQEETPFRYGYDKRTGLKYSLDEALKIKRNADIYIIAKRNGNIELNVVRTIPGTRKKYIPCESSKNKLSIEVNINQPLRRLNDKFRKFAQRCAYYLINGNGKINKSIEEELLKKDK